MPQQWLAHTTAPGVAPEDRRRLDFVVYGGEVQNVVFKLENDKNENAQN